LVGTVRELSDLRDLSIEVADKVIAESGVAVKYLVGTMIEIPRAALKADELAEVADFFSFGTNDLTQLTYGYSRDDAGVFLPEYVRKGVLPSDPFQQLDQSGVGMLVEMAAKKGRETNPDIHLGICGEHGGDASSVFFFHKAGLDYVSCSPFRVPIARLAAAQVVVEEKQAKLAQKAQGE
jgi:pyruvate,orthophosphate dikinase